MNRDQWREKLLAAATAHRFGDPKPLTLISQRLAEQDEALEASRKREELKESRDG